MLQVYKKACYNVAFAHLFKYMLFVRLVKFIMSVLCEKWQVSMAVQSTLESVCRVLKVMFNWVYLCPSVPIIQEYRSQLLSFPSHYWQVSIKFNHITSPSFLLDVGGTDRMASCGLSSKGCAFEDVPVFLCSVFTERCCDSGVGIDL